MNTKQTQRDGTETALTALKICTHWHLVAVFTSVL
jgi:hypothetical protein